MTLYFSLFPSPTANPIHNGNMYSLNTAKQVIMRCYLSRYWVFHCVLTPSFVLLGASAKSWCFGKIFHPSLPSKQVKAVSFHLESRQVLVNATGYDSTQHPQTPLLSLSPLAIIPTSCPYSLFLLPLPHSSAPGR